MVHFCIFTSLLHIGGWEKDCATAIFKEDLPSQLPTTLYGVDSRLPLPHRTQAIHGNSTRGITAQTSSIRPPERELPLPLETARRRRRRRRRTRTKFLHGVALQMSRSHRNRTQFPRPDVRSIANLPKAPWAHRRMRASELRLAAPSIRPMLPAAAAYPHDGRVRTGAVRSKSSSSIYIGRGSISSDSGWRVLPDIAAARASTKLSRQHPPSASSPGAPPHTARGREIPACGAPHSGQKKGFPIENPFWKQNIPGLPRRKKKVKEKERHIPAVTFGNETTSPISPERRGADDTCEPPPQQQRATGCVTRMGSASVTCEVDFFFWKQF
jgi:hypothetical protein